MSNDEVLRVTIWMNMPAYYQIDLFQELAAMEHVDLKIIFAYDLPPERQRLGWRAELNDQLDTHFLSPAAPVRDAIHHAWQQRERIHIVNGVWAESPFMAALAVLRFACPNYFVYAEAPNPLNQRSRLKLLLRKIIGPLLVGTSRAALLATSSFSRTFYQDYGFTTERIYDFGYFRNLEEGNQSSTEKPATTIIYVGQLTSRKRVDLLLEAAASLRQESARITIIGDGVERVNLEALSARLNIGDCVQFHGAVPSNTVMQRIADADVLVLPSEYDGWGMVVNEALMVGVPVIVSNACGAADLIQHGKNGFVFQSDDALSLRDALQMFLAADRNRLRHYAYATGQSLTAHVASRYLVKCIQHKLNPDHAKPTPPWLKSLDATAEAAQ